MLRPEVLPTGSCLFVCFLLCFGKICLFDISILFGHFVSWVLSFRVFQFSELLTISKKKNKRQ